MFKRWLYLHLVLGLFSETTVEMPCGLAITKKGHRAVLIIVEELVKVTRVALTNANSTAKVIAEAVYEILFKLVDVPKDNNRQGR